MGFLQKTLLTAVSIGSVFARREEKKRIEHQVPEEKLPKGTHSSTVIAIFPYVSVPVLSLQRISIPAISSMAPRR